MFLQSKSLTEKEPIDIITDGVVIPNVLIDLGVTCKSIDKLSWNILKQNKIRRKSENY